MLQVALKFDLIYAKSCYVYIVIHDLPRPGAANAPGASRIMDGIVGTTSHPQKYATPLMSYAPPEGGTSSSYNYPSMNPP